MDLNKDKNPWQSRKRPQLPDLNKLWQTALEKFSQSQLFDWLNKPGNPLYLACYGCIGLVVLWLISGVYIVDEGERGVVSRFGAYRETVLPGPHWHWPLPVEHVTKVNVERQRFLELGYRSRDGRLIPVASEALMLSGDENIVDVHLAIQYSIKDADDYLYNVQQPEVILKQVAESVTRGVIGKQNMDFVLTEGRSEIVALIESELQRIMDDYRAGIQVASVNLQDAQPPEEVQRAFEDAIKAREDKQRLINEAQAYANEIIPQARGASARMMEEAKAYQQAVIAKAKGETDRFRQILTKYRQHPQITRRRLAIEGMAEILAKTNLVMMDLEGNGNVVYLPLEQFTRGQTNRQDPPQPVSTHHDRLPSSAKTEKNGLRTVHRRLGGRGN